jgi:hypothetical protein
MPTSSKLQGILEPKDSGDTIPSDGGGKNPGEERSKFDFSHLDPGSHTNLGPQGPDHSDMHAALASMSSDDALDYAISQMGPADHFEAGHSDADHSDAGHLEIPVDTSPDS